MTVCLNISISLGSKSAVFLGSEKTGYQCAKSTLVNLGRSNMLKYLLLAAAMLAVISVNPLQPQWTHDCGSTLWGAKCSGQKN